MRKSERCMGDVTCCPCPICEAARAVRASEEAGEHGDEPIATEDKADELAE
jgi:hypothetical protein